jgi:nicotinate-nucleotide adenylyltransferase
MSGQLGGLTIASGMRIGILGGSFDPPHAGHLQLSTEALKRFGLDRVVWLVSPGNPLKPHAPAPLKERLAAARSLVRNPNISVSGYEARVGTRFTAATLERLRKDFRGVPFVWLMGADNLVQFHKWGRWRDIAEHVPIGVLARPSHRLAARTSVAARLYRSARLPENAAKSLAWQRAPAWCFLNMPMVDLSSSALRAKQGGQKTS